ncbi:MAG: UDP-N-acetylglucosamine acyltransferase [Phenylobacterium sp.]|jgi:UDP-N-acetylglucosamine acyltransferase
MIHESAIIDPSAIIGENVTIGPWSYIGADVVIGDDTIIESHVVVKGPTRIGKANHIFQFASVGEGCQDKKYAGEATELVIGDNNVFRESVTVHRGTIQDNSITIIGSGNLFMAYVHVAHDCVIGDNNILANNASLAGHVHVGDWVILGGFVAVHQYCHVGSHSFCSACSMVPKDLPPYVMASGQRAEPYGLNTEGMKRRGMDKDTISAIKQAYKEVYRKKQTINEALEVLAPSAEKYPQVAVFTDFIGRSSRGIIR